MEAWPAPRSTRHVTATRTLALAIVSWVRGLRGTHAVCPAAPAHRHDRALLSTVRSTAVYRVVPRHSRKCAQRAPAHQTANSLGGSTADALRTAAVAWKPACPLSQQRRKTVAWRAHSRKRGRATRSRASRATHQARPAIVSSPSGVPGALVRSHVATASLVAHTHGTAPCLFPWPATASRAAI